MTVPLIGIAGLGRAGTAMAHFCAQRFPQAKIIAFDCQPNKDITSLQRANITVFLGAEAFAQAAALNLSQVWISPGIDPKSTIMRAFVARNIPIAGELDLLAPYLTMPVAAITGTNGKSTVTALAGALLPDTTQAFVGGNLGPPVSTLFAQGQPQVAILEVSSYQIDTTQNFSPNVAVVLNVAPDHLARYHNLQSYAAAKARLVAMVPKDGTVILNYDCPITRKMATVASCRVLWLSRHRLAPGQQGFSIFADCVVATEPLAFLNGFALKHPQLSGPHNIFNGLAALAVVGTLGYAGNLVALQQCYHNFTGLNHRLEAVGIIKNVTYINDSKATNDHAAAAAVASMTTPFVLLVGGQDKQTGFAALLQALQQVSLTPCRVRAILCFGAARQVLGQALQVLAVPLFSHIDLAAAIKHAVHLAQPGDAVLFSPACASFDSFNDYLARGNFFTTKVAQFTKQVASW